MVSRSVSTYKLFTRIYSYMKKIKISGLLLLLAGSGNAYASGALGGNACFYSGQNYTGDEVCFSDEKAHLGIGEYDDKFRSVKFLNSLQSVELFEHPNFKGQSVKLTSSQPSLNSTFDAKVSSLRLRKQTGVCLYEHNDFTGNASCYTLSEGQNFTDIHLPGHANDKTSSIRLFGDGAVDVYEHGGRSGQSTRLMTNVSNLTTLNDRITSLRLNRRNNQGYACMFPDKAYRGTPYCMLGGESEGDLNRTVIRRNSTSSVILSKNVQLKMYERGHFENRNILTIKESWV